MFNNNSVLVEILKEMNVNLIVCSISNKDKVE